MVPPGSPLAPDGNTAGPQLQYPVAFTVFEYSPTQVRWVVLTPPSPLEGNYGVCRGNYGNVGMLLTLTGSLRRSPSAPAR